jgi:hypothetical protein
MKKSPLAPFPFRPIGTELNPLHSDHAPSRAMATWGPHAKFNAICFLRAFTLHPFPISSGTAACELLFFGQKCFAAQRDVLNPPDIFLPGPVYSFPAF